MKKNIDSTPSSVNSVVAHVMWIRPTHCDAPDWSGSELVVGNIATITAITLVARVISLSTWWPGSGLMLYDRKNTARRAQRADEPVAHVGVVERADRALQVATAGREVADGDHERQRIASTPTTRCRRNV